MILFFKNFLIALGVTILDFIIFCFIKDYSPLALAINSLVLCIIISFSCYFSLLKPLTDLYKALKVINFQDDMIDFTKVDTLKPKGYPEVKLVINKFKSLLDEITERVNKINTEMYKSEHDILTGCYNRTYLEKVKSSYENSTNFIVCFIDVNNLKRMNDEFGHEAGDKLLRTASSKLSYWSKLGDVYRLGGDEFMFVLVNKPLPEVKSRIISWHKTVGVLNATNDGFKCLLSYGIAEGKQGDNFDSVMKRADEIMYDMKVKIKKQLGEPLR